MNSDEFHFALLGDSIFDNAAYVPNGLAVIDQIRELLPNGHSATLIARDGDVAANVLDQLKGIPSNVTHLVLSVGGNDALGALAAMSLPATTVHSAMGILSKIRKEFHDTYRGMLKSVMSLQKPLAVCTIYESVPGLTEELKTALAIFNDTIVREALAARLPVIDLRLICTDPVDYSTVSPIEPSEKGGRKIAEAILECPLFRPRSTRIG